MSSAKGANYTITITNKVIHLAPNSFIDGWDTIDKVIKFENVIGFDYKPATFMSLGGYLHLRTWNPEGFINADLFSHSILKMHKNRNYLKFSYFQRKAFEKIRKDLQHIVDANKETLENRIKKDQDYWKKEELRASREWARMLEHRRNNPTPPRPVTYYGIWIDF